MANIDNRIATFKQLKRNNPDAPDETIWQIIAQAEQEGGAFNDMDPDEVIAYLRKLNSPTNASVVAPPRQVNTASLINPQDLEQSNERYRQYIQNSIPLQMGAAFGTSGAPGGSEGIFEKPKDVADNLFFRKQQLEAIKAYRDLQDKDLEASGKYNQNLMAAKEQERESQKYIPGGYYSQLARQTALSMIKYADLQQGEQEEYLKMLSNPNLSFKDIMDMVATFPEIQKAVTTKITQGKTRAETGKIGAETRKTSAEAESLETSLPANRAITDRIVKNAEEGAEDIVPTGVSWSSGPLSAGNTPKQTAESGYQAETLKEANRARRAYESAEPLLKETLDLSKNTWKGFVGQKLKDVPMTQQQALQEKLAVVIPAIAASIIDPVQREAFVQRGRPEVLVTMTDRGLENYLLSARNIAQKQINSYLGTQKGKTVNTPERKSTMGSLTEKNDKGWELMKGEDGKLYYVNPKNTDEYERAQ